MLDASCPQHHNCYWVSSTTDKILTIVKTTNVIYFIFTFNVQSNRLSADHIIGLETIHKKKQMQHIYIF